MLHHLWLARGGLIGLCRSSRLPAEAVAPRSHQLQGSITDLTRWTFMQAPGTQLAAVARAAFTAAFFTVWGLLPQGHLYKTKLPRAGCGGLGNCSPCLKEMTAWETSCSATCSCVFHKHTCKIKKLKERSAYETAIEIKVIPTIATPRFTLHEARKPLHKVHL